MASAGRFGVADLVGLGELVGLGGAVLVRGGLNDGSGGPPPGTAVGWPSTVLLQPASSSAAASVSFPAVRRLAWSGTRTHSPADICCGLAYASSDISGCSDARYYRSDVRYAACGQEKSRKASAVPATAVTAASE